MSRLASLLAAAAALALAASAFAADPIEKLERSARGTGRAWIVTRDGKSLEGTLAGRSLRLTNPAGTREIPVRDLLSLQTAGPASPGEKERITSGLAALAGTDRKARDRAGADLTDLGLPVMTPLLDALKDTDLHEPHPLYSLFARIVPGYADGPDRTLALVRLWNGEALRGTLQPADLTLTTSDAKVTTVPLDDVRRLAIRQKSIRKSFDVDSLRHCTQIDFLDTGVALAPGAKVVASAEGFVRLSFGIDGWACDADGIKVPGPHYTTTIVDGFPFGSLVGRVGPGGERWKAGRHCEKTGLGAGRLYLAVNDNGHWQNNIGSFRVDLRVTDAYDLGDPR